MGPKSSNHQSQGVAGGAWTLSQRGTRLGCNRSSQLWAYHLGMIEGARIEKSMTNLWMQSSIPGGFNPGSGSRGHIQPLKPGVTLARRGRFRISKGSLSSPKSQLSYGMADITTGIAMGQDETKSSADPRRERIELWKSLGSLRTFSQCNSGDIAILYIYIICLFSVFWTIQLY